jgi:hypothetical protein
MTAVGLRHNLDTADIVVWVLAAAAFAIAVWQHLRQKPEEDLTKTIFPDGDK